MRTILRKYGLTCLMVAILSPVAMASQTRNTHSKIKQLENKVDRLETQVDRLDIRLQQERKESVHADQRGKTKRERVLDKYRAYGSAVVIAPFTGRPTYFTADELIVNAPSINEDAKLLYRRKIEQEALLKLGEAIPKHPRLVLSGKVSGNFQYARPYDNPRSTDIDLSGAELDMFFEISPLVNGFMAFTYDNTLDKTFSKNRRIKNSNVELDKGFLVIGDFRRFPYYGSIGQMYVPFGRYGSNMISAPLTKYIGKTKARTIVLAYAPEDKIAPFARAFIFKGDSKYGSNSNLAKNYGVDLGFRYADHKVDADVGVSYIANVADADGMQNTGSTSQFGGFDISDLEMLRHRVGGVDLYGTIGVGKFNFLAEYIATLQQFNKNDLSFNGHGAKPQAFNIEGAYVFKSFNLPSAFAIGYGTSSEALGLNIPKHRFMATYRVTCLKFTTVSLEYRHDVNYDKSDTAAAAGSKQAYIPGERGKSSDAVTAEIAVYF